MSTNTLKNESYVGDYQSSFSLKSLILSRNPNFTLTCSAGNHKMIKVPINQIAYVESDGVICKFFNYNPSEKVIRIAHNISECELRLYEFAFIRVHRSYLVNCSFIKPINCKRDGFLHLSNEVVIPISRRRKNNIIHQLKTFGLDHLIEKHNN